MKKLLLIKLLLFLAVPAFAEVSFTFDDGWETTIQNGFPVLDQYHYPATVYVVTSFAGHNKKYMDWGELKVLSTRGWDIEDHSYSHQNLTKLSLLQARRDLDKSIYDLHWHGYTANHFAPPYGEVNPAVLKLIKRRFKSSRGAWVLGNELNWENNLQPYNLSVIALNEKTDMWLVQRCIEHATYEHRWLIFMVHRVVDDCSPTDTYSITRSKLKNIVEYCVGQGTKVVTVDQYFKNHGLEK